MKVLVEGQKSVSVGGIYGHDYEVDYSDNYKIGDIIDVILIDHRGSVVNRRNIKLEVSEEFLDHLQFSYEEVLEQERLSKLPKKYVCLYKLDLSSRLTGRYNDDISLEEAVFDYLCRNECELDGEDVEDFNERIYKTIHFLSPEEVKVAIEGELGIGFIDDSYLKELEYEIKRIERLGEDELDDWDKAYLRLDEERPNEYYVKIIKGNLDAFEEFDLNGFSYSMINSFICYI